MNTATFPERLHALVDVACTNDVGDAELRELDAMLRGDQQCRRFYASYCRLHAELLFSLRAEQAVRSVREAESLPKGNLPVLGFLGSAVQGTVAFFSQGMPLAYLLATIIFATGLWIGSLIFVSDSVQVVRRSLPPAGSTSEPKTEFVGQVTGMVDCRWVEKGARDGGQGTGAENPSSYIRRHKSLVALGDKFALVSGLMEITYRAGAKVILQGPVTYEVDSNNGGYLSIGRLTGKLEKRGEGPAARGEKSVLSSSFILHPSSFVIRTPTATITDLGTEFGVEVSETGATQTHVLQGAVELRVAGAGERGPRTIRLTEREAARVEVGPERMVTVRRMAASPRAFVRDLSGGKRIPLRVFSTGVNLAEGQSDPHWQIVAVSNDPKFPACPGIVISPARVTSAVPPEWLENEPTKSQWIALANPIQPNGVTYTFRTTFAIPAEMRPNTAVLRGSFIADNHVGAIRLNGHKLRVPFHGTEEMAVFHAFSITRGFVAGTNVLEIDVQNGSPEQLDGASAMGLRAELEVLPRRIGKNRKRS